MANGAFPSADGKIPHQRVLVSAAGARLAARIHRRYTDDGTAVPRGLIFEHEKEFCPRDACDGSGKFVIVKHPFYIQVFDADRLVFTDEHRRLFLQKVVPLVCDLLVDSGHLNALLVAIIGVFLFTGKPPLFPNEFALRPFQIFRVPDDISIAVGVKFLNPDINADRMTGVWTGLRLKINIQNDEIFPGRDTLDRNAVDMPGLHGLFYFYISELRQLQVLPDDTDVVALVDRPVGLAVIMLAFKNRMLCPFFEEIFEPAVEIPERLLQRDRIDFFEESIFFRFLKLGQHSGCLPIGRLFAGSIGAVPHIKPLVIDKATASESPVDEALLFLVRVCPEFNAFLRSHFLYNFLPRCSLLLYECA